MHAPVKTNAQHTTSVSATCRRDRCLTSLRMSSVVNGLSGWTGAVFALLAFAFAFGRRSPALGVLGAALSAPFCLCAKGYPIVGALAWAALVSNFIAACIVGLRRDIAVAALT